MNVVLSLMGEINELLKNSFLYLLHLFCCLLKQCPKSTHMPHYLVKTLVLWRKVKLILELITKIQVWSGALRGGIARALNHCGRMPKSSNNVTSVSFNTVDLLPKDIRFEQGGTKLASSPGRHLSSLRPRVWWVLQQIISLPYPVTSHWWESNFR